MLECCAPAWWLSSPEPAPGNWLPVVSKPGMVVFLHRPTIAGITWISRGSCANRCVVVRLAPIRHSEAEADSRCTAMAVAGPANSGLVRRARSRRCGRGSFASFCATRSSHGLAQEAPPQNHHPRRQWVCARPIALLPRLMRDLCRVGKTSLLVRYALLPVLLPRRWYS